MWEPLSKKFRDEVGLFIDSIIKKNPGMHLSSFLKDLKEFMHEYGSVSMMLLGFRLLSTSYQRALDKRINQLTISAYYIVLENQGIEIANYVTTSELLNTMLIRVTRNADEIQREFKSLAGKTQDDKIQTLAKIIEEKDSRHRIRSLLHVEDWMQVFTAHGLVSNNKEPERFKKLYNQLVLTLLSLAKIINADLLFRIMLENCANNIILKKPIITKAQKNLTNLESIWQLSFTPLYGNLSACETTSSQENTTKNNKEVVKLLI